MKYLLKNPITIWLKWYFETIILLSKERGKNLKIGYLTSLNDVLIGKYNTFYDNIIISSSTIGDFVYIGSNTKISNATIGKFCSIGPDVKIGLGKHPSHLISTFPAFFATRKQCQITFADKDYFEESGPIVVGNDVWIGADAIIMDDVTIGDGAIIAAGAVVTKNVEPYAIVGGVPARLIKKRFAPDEIIKLQNFKWWDKDISWLTKNFRSFNYPDVFFENTIKSSPAVLNIKFPDLLNK